MASQPTAAPRADAGRRAHPVLQTAAMLSIAGAAVVSVARYGVSLEAGGYLSVLLPMALALWAKGRSERIWRVAVVLVLIGAVIATGMTLG